MAISELPVMINLNSTTMAGIGFTNNPNRLDNLNNQPNKSSEIRQCILDDQSLSSANTFDTDIDMFDLTEVDLDAWG